nr:uncharacterized protein LOC107967407 [Pan troglodytes]
MLRDRKVVSFPRKDAADPSSEAHHPARHRGRAVDLRAVLSNTAATAHMWLFTVKLNKIQFLAHTNHISGAQEPQMVSERRAGQHRCRTLPPSQKVLLDATVPDPDGSSATDAIAQRLAAQHVPAVVGGESRQCPTAAARQWWHSAASRPTPPTSARGWEAASPSYLLLMGAMGIRVACLELPFATKADSHSQSLPQRTRRKMPEGQHELVRNRGLGGVRMWAQVRACTLSVCMWGSVCKPAVVCVGPWGSPCSRVYVGGVVCTMCV